MELLHHRWQVIASELEQQFQVQLLDMSKPYNPDDESEKQDNLE